MATTMDINVERVKPENSQTLGTVISTAFGFIVTGIIWGFLKWKMPFWHFGDFFGPLLGISLGAMSGFAMYFMRIRTTPLYWEAVETYFGNPTGRIFKNGKHWVRPFFGLQNVPSPDKVFVILMPGERIDAQDSSLIFFGDSEDADKHPGKRNRIQISVVNPFLFMMAESPIDEAKEAYLMAARLFLNKVTMAVGVKSENSLFGDFVSLPYGDDPDEKDERNKYEARLRSAMFVDAGKKGKPSVRFMSDDLVTTLMEKTAGKFRQSLDSWGLGKLAVFTPSIRENPQAEAAGAARSAMKDQMAGLDTQMKKIKKLAGDLTDDGVTADLAATLVAGRSGQTVDIENKTVNIPGLKEGLEALVGLVGKIAGAPKSTQRRKRKKTRDQVAQPTRSQS